MIPSAWASVREAAWRMHSVTLSRAIPSVASAVGVSSRRSRDRRGFRWTRSIGYCFCAKAATAATGRRYVIRHPTPHRDDADVIASSRVCRNKRSTGSLLPATAVSRSTSSCRHAPPVTMTAPGRLAACLILIQFRISGAWTAMRFTKSSKLKRGRRRSI